MKNYEEAYDLLGGVPVPTEEGHLEVEWLIADRLGLGRDSMARFVVVLAGGLVDATSETVKQSLMHGQWKQSSGEHIEGNALRLPHGAPFQVAATTIAIELIRRGIESRVASDVFKEVESFIELVIRRVLLPPESILGLLGELLVLDYGLAALDQIPQGRRPDRCSLWRGHTYQARDFVLNRLALEVKTTTGPSSRHHISNLDQVEARTLDGGHTEELYLVSVGLAEEAAGSSRFSIAQLTNRIMGRLDDAEASRFLEQLEQYGPEDCGGYKHALMADWEPYVRRYRLTFQPRIYDISDVNLRLIRRSDLQNTFVLPEGISYSVDLPEVVPGSHGNNPRNDLPKQLLRLFEAFA